MGMALGLIFTGARFKRASQGLQALQSAPNGFAIALTVTSSPDGESQLNRVGQWT